MTLRGCSPTRWGFGPRRSSSVPPPAHDNELTFELRRGEQRIGALVIPGAVSPRMRERLADRVVPALEALLAAALERDRLQSEVVETRALRRSDELKTALLRTVSHDLRSSADGDPHRRVGAGRGRDLARRSRGARAGDRRGGRAPDGAGREAAGSLATAGGRR